MHRISILALAIAFVAELAADMVIQALLILAIGGTGDASQADAQAAFDAVSATPAFITAVLVFGTATTFGGGYLAARIARKFPYYHGLAMGLLGIAFVLYFWQANDLWMNLLSLVSNIPISIWGAHLAKRHIPATE